MLCKYGIEYVDDPATGKKIPTCHRSSFESVLDDSNFDQAMENADVVARKVYREEAKQIEELRKGIIEVSAKEEPYDIFICYKETDDKGDRTLDSVLAQDIYDALAEKGYRVFFSRITLEDKLGQEYEPYIFAALNSAKILLAVGTDYEYYNAVWVKNEWSRYLMLMAKDRTKHLIPCYKNIDAYDMPKEFAKLQAQDMGKVGAMQDLMRGIEKILPKSAPATVIQEKVIVSGGEDNKITSLLDRGNMALEDGDWDKADAFFEEVLNNDSKNAEAYLGKTLAQECCRNLEALVGKRLEVNSAVIPDTLYIPERTAHIKEMAEKYRLPGYVAVSRIEMLYSFDRAYLSYMLGRQVKYKEEEEWWKDHKLLSRAEKFATGAVAERIQQEKKNLFTQLANQVKAAQEADAKRVKELETTYDSFLAEADQAAEKAYNEGAAKREADYQSWLEDAKKECNPEGLLWLARHFESLGEYKDSRILAEHCRKRAEEERAKLDEERESQKAIAEQMQRKAAAKKKKLAAIVVVVVAVVIAAVLLVTKVIIPENAYKKAESLLANGQYEEAGAAFGALGGYKDSQQRIEDCKTAEIEADYQAANELAEKGRFEDAITAFENLGDYKDSTERALEASYKKAQDFFECGDFPSAAMTFGQIGNYQDAKQRSTVLWNDIAMRNTISADFSTVGLKINGTVVATGNNDMRQCNVDDWCDIVAISAGQGHTVGLKSNGTVVAVGRNDKGQCNVGNWEDIVAVDAGFFHTVGLKSDGTVVAVGFNPFGECDIREWKNIVAISAGSCFTAGLKSDGTVLATGYNKYGQCNVGNWKDIVGISAGRDHMVGLKSDGTVLAVGDKQNGQCDTDNWQNIVATSAGYYHTVGLKNDGTVMAVGATESFNYNQCNVGDWRDVVAISTGATHTVGLKFDGTVVAAGYNSSGQCDVSEWRDIKIPDSIIER